MQLPRLCAERVPSRRATDLPVSEEQEVNETIAMIVVGATLRGGRSVKKMARLCSSERSLTRPRCMD